jgi:SAM-dependent methyltransferase
MSGTVVRTGIDFGKTAEDYGRHRAGFPEETFERLERAHVGVPGQRVLDVGAGTGAMARGLAARGALVTVLDPSSTLLDEAERLASEAGLSLDRIVATAERTGLGDASFDAVTAGQCWHWFDRSKAAAELLRVLVPSGTLAIVHFDWIAAPNSVVALSEALIIERTPGVEKALREGPSRGTGIYSPWLEDVTAAGFVDLETFSFDVSTPYTSDAWRGRIRASAFVGASHGAEWVAAFDVEHARRLDAAFPSGRFEAPHRVFALLAHKPA